MWDVIATSASRWWWMHEIVRCVSCKRIIVNVEPRKAFGSKKGVYIAGRSSEEAGEGAKCWWCDHWGGEEGGCTDKSSKLRHNQILHRKTLTNRTILQCEAREKVFNLFRTNSLCLGHLAVFFRQLSLMWKIHTGVPLWPSPLCFLTQKQFQNYSCVFCFLIAQKEGFVCKWSFC